MKKLFYIALVGIVTTMVCGACEKEESDDVLAQIEDARSRGASLNDSTESDSGKVRIGDVVIDTTWNGETHIYI